jgi:hypothetical protein
LSNHPVTRAGKPTEVLVVRAGKLLVYVDDLPAARAAVNCVPAGLSTRAVAAGSDDEDEALAPTILLRFAGAARVNRVQGFGTRHGTPRIRIQTEHLTALLRPGRVGVVD